LHIRNAAAGMESPLRVVVSIDQRNILSFEEKDTPPWLKWKNVGRKQKAYHNSIC